MIYFTPRLLVASLDKPLPFTPKFEYSREFVKWFDATFIQHNNSKLSGETMFRCSSIAMRKACYNPPILLKTGPNGEVFTDFYNEIQNLMNVVSSADLATCPVVNGSMPMAVAMLLKDLSLFGETDKNNQIALKDVKLKGIEKLVKFGLITYTDPDGSNSDMIRRGKVASYLKVTESGHELASMIPAQLNTVRQPDPVPPTPAPMPILATEAAPPTSYDDLLAEIEEAEVVDERRSW